MQDKKTSMRKTTVPIGSKRAQSTRLSVPLHLERHCWTVLLLQRWAVCSIFGWLQETDCIHRHRLWDKAVDVCGGGDNEVGALRGA